MFINATTRQQISVYSKLTFACLYPPHLEKWGVQKCFRERIVLYPLTFRISAPPHAAAQSTHVAAGPGLGCWSIGAESLLFIDLSVIE